MIILTSFVTVLLIIAFVFFLLASLGGILTMSEEGSTWQDLALTFMLIFVTVVLGGVLFKTLQNIPTF